MNKQCLLALKKQNMQHNVVLSKSPKTLETRFVNLVFTTKYGTALNSQIYCDAIKRIVDEINLMRDEIECFEQFSGHTFRHTFATRSFESGIQPKTVQRYLGHASLQMTMDLYTHVLKEHLESEMDKLEGILDSVLDVSDESIQAKFEQTTSASNKKKIVTYSSIALY